MRAARAVLFFCYSMLEITDDMADTANDILCNIGYLMSNKVTCQHVSTLWHMHVPPQSQNESAARLTLIGQAKLVV